MKTYQKKLKIHICTWSQSLSITNTDKAGVIHFSLLITRGKYWLISLAIMLTCKAICNIQIKHILSSSLLNKTVLLLVVGIFTIHFYFDSIWCHLMLNSIGAQIFDKLQWVDAKFGAQNRYKSCTRVCLLSENLMKITMALHFVIVN